MITLNQRQRYMWHIESWAFMNTINYPWNKSAHKVLRNVLGLHDYSLRFHLPDEQVYTNTIEIQSCSSDFHMHFD